jgi:long-chain fatty acid transport protein
MTFRSMHRAAIVIAAAACALVPSRASAGGLYFSDRGVRPLSRAGAFVAGADDLGAIWYNPAGLADAGTSFMLDASWLNYGADFTRKSRVVDSGGTVRTYDFPTVTGKTPFLPIPTIGFTYNFGEQRKKEPVKPWTFGMGAYAPYTAITSFPLTADNQPAPSRYSLVSLDGSLLVIIGAYLAYKPIPELSLGVGVSALVGTFQSQVVFNTNPADRLLSAPEDPAYDSLSQLKVGPIFAPSATAGVTWTPEKHVRLGLSGQLPYWINAPAQVSVRLPSAAPFDNASQQGSDARVKFRLPPILRLGVEARPVPQLRVELAYAHEFWSLHDTIDVLPDNIALVGVTGFPSPFPVGKITLPRNFQDSNSIHLGGEYHVDVGKGAYGLDLRAGVAFEQSAIPTAYLSPLTVDMNKVTVAIGNSIRIGSHWRFDLTYAHVFAFDVDVSPDEAAIGRVNPVHGNLVPVEAVNGGHYSAKADVLGVGLNYRF